MRRLRNGSGVSELDRSTRIAPDPALRLPLPRCRALRSLPRCHTCPAFAPQPAVARQASGYSADPYFDPVSADPPVPVSPSTRSRTSPSCPRSESSGSPAADAAFAITLVSTLHTLT